MLKLVGRIPIAVADLIARFGYDGTTRPAETADIAISFELADLWALAATRHPAGAARRLARRRYAYDNEACIGLHKQRHYSHMFKLW
jgi:hypothetical protein